ncbi:MAG: hypothetical protein JWL90_744 [Chthoniobacteraceae bacterium]|nr:hypothetical protein [Chthoniobacteraceae bacterium]
MDIVPIEVFAIAVEIPFASPLGFHQAKIEEFGGKICHAQTGLNLRPDQIRLRRTDELYNYELIAQFFGENGTLVRNAAGVKFSIRNGRTAADWTIIQENLMRFYRIMEFEPTTVSMLVAHVHAKFPSLEERDEYLAKFSAGPLIARPAALGYVQIADWEKEVRVLIEQSNQVPQSVFVVWETQFINSQDWETFLATLPVVMENSANLFSLGFEPFRQTL